MPTDETAARPDLRQEDYDAASKAFALAATALDRLICDVGASGVEHDDPRLDYVTVQIDRDVWERVREVVRHPMRRLP